MKKIIAAFAAVIMIASAFTACSDPLAEKKARENTDPSAATEAVTEAPKAEDFENTFEGLRDYMIAEGFMRVDEDDKNVTKMQAELIGAEKGFRYVMDKVSLELYEFKSGEDKTKNEIIASVKKNGYYTLYSRDIEAYLSSDEKYLMIYGDGAIGKDDTTSEAYQKKQNAIKAFKAFGK